MRKQWDELTKNATLQRSGEDGKLHGAGQIKHYDRKKQHWKGCDILPGAVSFFRDFPRGGQNQFHCFIKAVKPYAGLTEEQAYGGTEVSRRRAQIQRLTFFGAGIICCIIHVKLNG